MPKFYKKFLLKIPGILIYLRDIDSTSRGNSMTQNRRNLLPCTFRTSRQLNAVLSKAWMSAAVVWLGSKIFGIGIWTSARCVCQVPCCGQDGYQDQVL